MNVAQLKEKIDVFLEAKFIPLAVKLKLAILDYFGPKSRSKRRNTKTESPGFKDNDLWIATVAIQHSLTLVSADSDIQRLDGIEGLRVENW